MHGDGFEACGVIGLASCPVEVVPDGDPVEAKFFDAMPQRAQDVVSGVLKTGVYAKRGSRELDVASHVSTLVQ